MSAPIDKTPIVDSKSYDDAPVLFETRATASGHLIGIAILNRPRQLNALNLPMCALLLEQFSRWASDQRIVAVVLHGAGDKGFCAGGDVTEVARHILADGPERFVYGDRFFAVEYQLDALIHAYPKPFVAYAHGVCMGGGLGLFAAASHRIISDHARLAMPEIHIGLFPDVGAGYFLNRVPGNAGVLLASTGLIINEADALFAGIADHFWPFEEHQKLFDGLVAIAWQAHAQLDRIALDECLAVSSRRYLRGLPVSNLRQYFDAIRYITSAPTAAALRDSVVAAAREDPWFQAPADNLIHGSPLSAALIVDFLRRTRKLSVDQVLALDLKVAKQCQRHHDFAEGVRALLIDKDRKPAWSYSAIEDVPDSLVHAHFEDLN